MTSPKISTIIFDLSEVLITGLLDIEKPLAQHMGIPLDGLFMDFGGKLLTDLFCGRITENAYLAQLIQRHHWNLKVNDLKSILRSHFRQRIPGMDSIINTLDRQYELVLLSDHAEEWISYIKTIHPFLQSFTHQFYSYQLGQTKSESSTFTRVLDAIQRHPKQCLFIDDLHANITVAEKAGIRGIRFVDAGNLRWQLHTAGIFIHYPTKELAIDADQAEC